jgi:hypothetical protein
MRGGEPRGPLLSVGVFSTITVLPIKIFLPAPGDFFHMPEGPAVNQVYTVKSRNKQQSRVG